MANILFFILFTTSDLSFSLQTLQKAVNAILALKRMGALFWRTLNFVTFCHHNKGKNIVCTPAGISSSVLRWAAFYFTSLSTIFGGYVQKRVHLHFLSSCLSVCLSVCLVHFTFQCRLTDLRLNWKSPARKYKTWLSTLCCCSCHLSSFWFLFFPSMPRLQSSPH